MEKAGVLSLFLINFGGAALHGGGERRFSALDFTLSAKKFAGHFRKLLLELHNLALLARDFIGGFLDTLLAIGNLPFSCHLCRRGEGLLLVLKGDFEAIKGGKDFLVGQAFLRLRLNNGGFKASTFVQGRDRYEWVEVLVNRCSNLRGIEIGFREDSLLDVLDFLAHRLCGHCGVRRAVAWG